MAVHVLPPPGTRREGTASGCPSARKSRRDVLGAAGFTALAGIAAAAIAKPDASATATPRPPHSADPELIAIGREAAALIERRKPLEARWWALPRGTGLRRGTPAHREMNAIAEAMEPIDNRLEELVGQALELQATSREGLIAKAHLVRHEMTISFVSDGRLDIEGLDSDQRLIWGLVDDLLAVRS